MMIYVDVRGHSWRSIPTTLARKVMQTLEQLVEDADDKLFTNAVHNKEHVLYHLFPGTSEIHYHLRPRRHNLVLSIRSSSITDRDFITRMIFKDIY